VTEGCRKLYNEEISNVTIYNNEDQVKEGEREGNAAHMREMRNAYKILVGKPGEKRPLGRPGHI
jgi:hypothetical protein